MHRADVQFPPSVGGTVVCHDDLRWLDQMSRGDTHRLKRRSEDGLLIPSRDDERDEVRMWHGVLRSLTTEVTDRRRQGRWSAQGAYDLPPGVERRSGAAVRSTDFVRRLVSHVSLSLL